MDREILEATARALVADGKGILAADESSGTIKKRFAAVGLESTEEARRTYREMLFTAPGVEGSISGVILYDETIRQGARDGRPFPRLLAGRGILPGIKVDAGAKDMAGFPGEKVTEGLDGLRDRLAQYKELGARFAKWRAVIAIGADIPSAACIHANAQALARYAALCQEVDIVPIVEPEVLMDGDHDLQRCAVVTEATLRAVFAALAEQRIHLEGILLKPNMVVSGKLCPVQAGVDEVAEATLRVLLRAVPAAVPGIVFLSGGQGPVEATRHLNAMNARGRFPWKLSFSYGRALQEPSLDAWRGAESGFARGQELFSLRARCNGAAALGQYTAQMEG